MEEERKRSVFITGFGKFHGVEENPSSLLVGDLLAAGIPGVDIDGRYNEMIVLDVDVPHCQSYFEGIKHQDGDIFVHIGVNGRTDVINLEKFAYNNMNFRVPDESGFCPSDELIDTECSLDQPLGTELDVDKIVSELRADGLPFVVSTDPGRFICNYIYYSSLKNFSKTGCARKSVFVHIPPFEKIDRKAQLTALRALIMKLYNDHL